MFQIGAFSILKIEWKYLKQNGKKHINKMKMEIELFAYLYTLYYYTRQMKS